MAVSPYFNHVGHAGQQKLVEDLIVQAVQQRGVDIMYLPRAIVEDNELFNEATKSKFANAHTLEVHVESITNFNGMGDIWSQMGGMEMEDRMTIMFSQKRFAEELGDGVIPQPNDLVYVPYTDTMFEVTKPLEDEDYHQWGKNYVFRLLCSKFDYGHEDISTGIAELDDISEVYEEPVPTPGDVDTLHQVHDENANVSHTVDAGDAFNPFIGGDPFGSGTV